MSDASALAPRDSATFTTLRVILEAATDAATDVESRVSARRVALARPVSGDALPDPGDLVRGDFAAVASGVDEVVVQKHLSYAEGVRRRVLDQRSILSIRS